jgi:hypothetical protein
MRLRFYGAGMSLFMIEFVENWASTDWNFMKFERDRYCMSMRLGWGCISLGLSATGIVKDTISLLVSISHSLGAWYSIATETWKSYLITTTLITLKIRGFLLQKGEAGERQGLAKRRALLVNRLIEGIILSDFEGNIGGGKGREGAEPLVIHNGTMNFVREPW